MWADVQKTGSLSLSQVSCFDETHKKCVIGGQGHDQRGSRRGFRFRRNADGQPVVAGTPSTAVLASIPYQNVSPTCDGT